jgi:hypothetical protein
MVLDDLGHPVLASAAYNAGPGRARRWRDAKPLEGAIYAETIPFNETRDYVKKVMANTMYYSQLFGGKLVPLKERLGQIPAKVRNGAFQRRVAVKHENFLVVGGSGFVGRHLVAALAARGARVTVPTRRRDRAKHLILLPTVDVVEADVREPGVLARLGPGRDTVVNLAGRAAQPAREARRAGTEPLRPAVSPRCTWNSAQAVVSACRAAGVKRLLHMSALGADPAAPSEYLRSKGFGEQAVLAADDLGRHGVPAVSDLRARRPVSSTCSRSWRGFCR